MRVLALLAFLVGGTAFGAPDERPPAPPSDLDIDLSNLVLEQVRKAPPQKNLVLCELGDQRGCEVACADKSGPSCSRLGWALATGGADNPLLPVKEREQDFVGAEVAFDQGCKLGYLPACVDAELARRAQKKPPSTAQLRTACSGGYGRACSELAASVAGEAAKLALYEQGCTGGDGEACIFVADRKQDLEQQLAWYRRAFKTSSRTKVPLACPAGTQARRTVSAITFAWTLYTPRWACARIDPKSRRFVEHGPYLELASEEDEAVYPYGIISERGTMVDGARDGLVEHWNGRGALTSWQPYKAGREDGIGVSLVRGRSGAIEGVTRKTFVAGRAEGEARSIRSYDDAQFRALEIGTYRDGLKVGPWTTTRVEAKRVITVERYAAGKLDGDITHYDERTGALVQRSTYAGGVAIKGQRYNQGKLWIEIVYRNGRRREERELDEAGQLKAITTYDESGSQRTSRKIRGKRGRMIPDPDFDD